MHIIKIGIPKSGNFWLHTILHEIVNHSGLLNKSFIQNQPIYELAKSLEIEQVKGQIDIDCLDITKNAVFYRISNVFRYPVDDIEDYINCSTVVWTHSQMSDNALRIIQKFDKRIYIVRDPRDVLVSWSNFVFSHYMRRYFPFHIVDATNSETYLMKNMTTIVSDWMNHVGGYLRPQKNLNIHFVFYERLLESFDIELQKMLEYLEIELEEKYIREIKEKVAFSNMKKESPKHLKKGKIGQWVDILSDSQKQDILQMATPLLKLFNYPLNDRIDTLPELPDKLPENLNLPDGEVVLMKPSNH